MISDKFLKKISLTISIFLRRPYGSSRIQSLHLEDCLRCAGSFCSRITASCNGFVYERYCKGLYRYGEGIEFELFNMDLSAFLHRVTKRGLFLMSFSFFMDCVFTNNG